DRHSPSLHDALPILSVLSQSNKYVCAKCRSKIPIEDLEYIFVSQTSPFSFGKHRLEDRWSLLSENNKRLMVEHLCEELVVARESDRKSTRLNSSHVS